MSTDNNSNAQHFTHLKRQLGFTLIEILVALTITSIALMAGAKASMSLSNNSERIGNLLLAQICAENQMIKVRLEKQMPSIGDSDFTCSQGQKEFIGKVKIQPTPNPNFRRMDVQILDRQGPILSLSTIVGKL
jgi:general secretion pathway protein I